MSMQQGSLSGAGLDLVSMTWRRLGRLWSETCWPHQFGRHWGWINGKVVTGNWDWDWDCRFLCFFFMLLFLFGAMVQAAVADRDMDETRSSRRMAGGHWPVGRIRVMRALIRARRHDALSVSGSGWAATCRGQCVLRAS